MNFWVSDVLKKRFEDALGSSGAKMSETLRAFMDEYATRHEELKKKC